MVDPERIWKIVENNRLNVPKKKRQPGSSLTLFDRLYDCYVECIQSAGDKSADKRFRGAVNLLKNINPAYARPSIHVNLYPDEKGYSLMLCASDDGESEEMFLPYEDNEIFSYLDNQQIPPVLLEVLEKTQHCYMYNGCLICEVRNYRNTCQSSLDNNYETHLLLLRPTTETLLTTVNELAHETRCSSEEKLFLESRLLLATQPPICLDPSTDVLCVTNRLQYNRRKFHSHSVRRYLRRRSHAWRFRMNMMSQGKAPDSLKLHDFITEKRKDTVPEMKRDFSNLWKLPKVDVAMPENIDKIGSEVAQLAKVVPQAQAELELLQQYTNPPQTQTQLSRKRSVVRSQNVDQGLQTNVFSADHLLNSQNSSEHKQIQAPVPSKPQATPPQAVPISQTTPTAPPTKPPPTTASPSTTTNIPQQVLLSATGVTFGNLHQFTNQKALLNQLIQQHHQQVQQQQQQRSNAKPPRLIAPAPSSSQQLQQSKPSGGGGVPQSMTSVALQRFIQQRMAAVQGKPLGAVVASTKSSSPGVTGSAVVVLPRSGSGTQGQAVVQVSALRTPATPPLKRPHVPTEVKSATPTSSALTPPKLRPSIIPPPIPPAKVTSGMPRLHPLVQEAASSVKPPTLQMGPSSSPQATKMVNSMAPAMPQLHKMPSSMSAVVGSTQPRGGGGTGHAPPLKPSPKMQLEISSKLTKK